LERRPQAGWSLARRPAQALALALALGGALLTFTAPAHRPDLLAIGLVALAAAMAWQPALSPGLVAAAVPLYFFPRQIAGPLSFSPPGLLLVVAWLGVLANRLAPRWRGRTGTAAPRWPRTPYDAPIAVFLVAALLSMLVTEYPLLSVRELRALILEPVLFFWLLAVLKDEGAVRTALTGFLTGAAVVGGVAIAQVGFGFGGTAAEGVRRAQAWYPSPNHLALLMGRALPYFAAFALGPGAGPAATRPAGAWLGLAVVAVALLLTFSTGGWLGAAVALVAVLVALGRRQAALRLGGVAAAGLLAVSLLSLAGVLPERLNPLRQTGGFRVELWSSTFDMIRGHPLLGVGLDNFVYLYQQVYLHEGAAAEPNLSHPHNWLLHLWVQLGLPGLLAFLWLVGRFAAEARRALRRPGSRCLVAGAVGALADMLAHGLVDNSYFLVDLAFVFWLTLAAASGAPANEPSEPVGTLGAT